MNIKYAILSAHIALIGSPCLGAAREVAITIEKLSDRENSSDAEDTFDKIATIETLPGEIPARENLPNAQVKKITIPMEDTSNEIAKQKTMTDLPYEVLLELIKLLDPKSLKQITQVNKDFEKITLDARNNLLLNIHDGDPQQALFHAAQKNIPWAIYHLIQQGADINAVDSRGRTALQLAANAQHERVVAELLNNGVNYNKNCTTIFDMQFQIFYKKYPKTVNITMPYCISCLSIGLILLIVYLTDDISYNAKHTNSTMG